jgi:hypothetical protein
MRLFQNPVIAQHCDAINKAGEAAGELLPAYKVYRDIGCFGSKRWEPEFFAHYVLVADIDTDELEEAFAIHNRVGAFDSPEDEARIKRHGRQHSMSVGDILEHEGQYWMVDGVGFTPIDVREIVWFYREPRRAA